MDASGWAALSGIANFFGNRMQNRYDDERQERIRQLQESGEMKRQQFLIDAREAAAARERAAEQDAYNRKVVGTYEDPETGNVHSRFGDGSIAPDPSFQTSPQYQANLRRSQQLETDLDEARLGTLTSKIQKMRQSAAGATQQSSRSASFGNVVSGVGGTTNQPRPKRDKAPSGYQWTSDGSGLEPIPGGPKDPKATQGAHALSAEARRGLSLIDNSLANAREYQRRVTKGQPAGGFDDIAARFNDTPQLMQSAVQDMLYAKSGASAPTAEVEKAYSMYAPSTLKLPFIGTDTGIPNERDSTASAKVQRFIDDMQRMREHIVGSESSSTGTGSADQGRSSPAARRVGDVIQGPDGKKYRIIGGDPNDPDVEPAE